MTENDEIIKKINDSIDAINTLSKRLDKKSNKHDLQIIVNEIVTEFDLQRVELSKFTTGMIDFYTETIGENIKLLKDIKTKIQDVEQLVRDL